MIYEKIATPKRSINATKTLSKSLLGFKSPNPTVDREVKAKYINNSVLYASVFDSVPKY